MRPPAAANQVEEAAGGDHAQGQPGLAGEPGPGAGEFLRSEDDACDLSDLHRFPELVPVVGERPGGRTDHSAVIGLRVASPATGEVMVTRQVPAGIRLRTWRSGLSRVAGVDEVIEPGPDRPRVTA